MTVGIVSTTASLRGIQPVLVFQKQQHQLKSKCESIVVQRLQARNTTSHNGSKAQVGPRKTGVTSEQRTILRAARKQQAAKTLETASQNQTASSTVNTTTSTGVGTNVSANAMSMSMSSQLQSISSSNNFTGGKPLDARLIFGLGFGIPTILLTWGIYDESSPPAKFAQSIGLTDKIMDVTSEFTKPKSVKLLPDWSQMPNVPPNMPPPPTLVLDLENTLIHSTWDRKTGWRYAKRPGVDAFLTAMADYYEIVLYCPSHEGIAAPVVDLLDKKGCIMHRLYRDACHYTNGIYVKDLSSLNRNINTIILLDDDPKAALFHPQNLIRVKPFDDPQNTKDDTLERITPFLIEIAREGYKNVPQLLSQFHQTDMDADDIANELDQRVLDLHHNRNKTLKRGALGALASKLHSSTPSMSSAAGMEPEMTPVPQRYRGSASQQQQQSSQQLTAKDLVKSSSSSSSSTTLTDADAGSGISGWLKRRQVEQQEQQMRKLEKWNEEMIKKSAEKKQQEQMAS